MENQNKKMINITDEELDRDLVNLHLPEVDITPEKVPCYSPEMEEWLKNGRKGKPEDYGKGK